ncbi:MAG: VanZ family protein [Bacteroidota bacterium]|nr:VanZ family protein [Bacteroidota bacterium]
MRTRHLQFIPGILWLAFCFYLLTIPGKKIPQISWMDFYQADKLVHIVMFFTLGFLFSFAVKRSDKKYLLILMIAIGGIVFGIAMEFVQKYFIPNRSFDVNDMIADGIGCLAAYFWWRRRFKKSDVNYL